MKPLELQNFDGTQNKDGMVKSTAHIQLQISDHQESLFCYVTDIDTVPLVLGLLWLQKHDVEIGFKTNTNVFPESSCAHHGL